MAKGEGRSDAHGGVQRQSSVLDCDDYPEAVTWLAELVIWRFGEHAFRYKRERMCLVVIERGTAQEELKRQHQQGIYFPNLDRACFDAADIRFAGPIGHTAAGDAYPVLPCGARPGASQLDGVHHGSKSTAVVMP
jgi:hypothetical protein